MKKSETAFSLSSLSIYPIIKISYKVNKGNWSGWINTADISALANNFIAFSGDIG